MQPRGLRPEGGSSRRLSFQLLPSAFHGYLTHPVTSARPLADALLDGRGRCAWDRYAKSQPYRLTAPKSAMGARANATGAGERPGGIPPAARAVSGTRGGTRVPACGSRDTLRPLRPDLGGHRDHGLPMGLVSGHTSLTGRKTQVERSRGGGRWGRPRPQGATVPPQMDPTDGETQLPGFLEIGTALAHRETQPHAPPELPSARVPVSAAAKSTVAGPGGLRGRRCRWLGRLGGQKVTGPVQPVAGAARWRHQRGDGGGGALRGPTWALPRDMRTRVGVCVRVRVHTGVRVRTRQSEEPQAEGTRTLLAVHPPPGRNGASSPQTAVQTSSERSVCIRLRSEGLPSRRRSSRPVTPSSLGAQAFSEDSLGTRLAAGGCRRPARLRRQLAGPAGALCGAGGVEHLRG